jgi:hypothetical protein
LISVKFVLLVLAVVFFGLAAAGVGAGRVGLVPAGLLCWLLSEHV